MVEIRKQKVDLDGRMEKSKALLDEIATEATKIFGKKVTRGDILSVLSRNDKDWERQEKILFEKGIINDKNRKKIFDAVSVVGNRLMLHPINQRRK